MKSSHLLCLIFAPAEWKKTKHQSSLFLFVESALLLSVYNDLFFSLKPLSSSQVHHLFICSICCHLGFTFVVRWRITFAWITFDHLLQKNIDILSIQLKF